MERLPTRLPHLDPAPPRRRFEHGRIGIREAIAVAAIAVVVLAAVVAGLETAGFDTVEWIREQLGLAG